MEKRYDEAKYEKLFAELVPASGKCETFEGELLRAISKIYYDYTNNGFGNNWSGAYNFLDQHFGLLRSERVALGPYARGRVCQDADYDENDPILRVLDELLTRIINHIGDKRTPNFCDMYDLQEGDMWGISEEEEDESNDFEGDIE